jgi:hypothetical protein
VIFTDFYVFFSQNKLNVERNNPLYLVSWGTLVIIEKILIIFYILKSIQCLQNFDPRTAAGPRHIRTSIDKERIFC